MTRRAWFASLAALVPFAGRFQGPVALGTLRVGERFRFAVDGVAYGLCIWERTNWSQLPKPWIEVRLRGLIHGEYSITQSASALVYRVR